MRLRMKGSEMSLLGCLGVSPRGEQSHTMSA